MSMMNPLYLLKSLMIPLNFTMEVVVGSNVIAQHYKITAYGKNTITPKPTEAIILASTFTSLHILNRPSSNIGPSNSTGPFNVTAKDPLQSGFPKVINTRPISYVNVFNSVPTSPNKNGSEQVGNEPIINEIPLSYVNKLIPTSLTKANLRKLEVNQPNDADDDVWLPLASVHEVNDRMKNSLYGYFIGKRLSFPVVEWFVRNNWEKYGLKKVMMVKGFFFFKFSSSEVLILFFEMVHE
ncbi:hypothetical protein Tco_0399798 [Tanacetum coccineum]